MSVGASADVIERTCWACDTDFLSGSRAVRMYCPACVSVFDFPAPVEPSAPVRRVATASSRRRDVVSALVRSRCEVCGQHVHAGQVRCSTCADQLPMFSAKVDRRRKEWRDED